MSFFDRFKKKNKEAEKPKAEAAKPAAAPVKAAAAAPVKAGAACANKPEGGNLMAAADLGALLPGAPPGGKINLAIYWAAACGGCDVSLLDTNERILTIGDMANIVMWPIAMDGKEKDIAAMKDKEITVSIISGAIRNSENEHMAKLLRQKSLILVSYGSCACFGGSPALANLVPGGAKDLLDYAYVKVPSTASFQADYHKGKPVLPQTSYQAPEGELTLPVIYDVVKTLDQTVDVDYYVPGCPPLQETISHMLAAVANFAYKGVPLPPKGTVIGVTNMSLCDQCSRHKEFRRITAIKEPFQVNVDPDLCLMDQGILCLGPATVGGCNARCTKVGQPCRGCYGPTTEVQEHGASALTAIASLFPILEEDGIMGEDQIIDIMSTIKDPLGYFYAFTMSKSLIKRAVKEKGGR